MSPVTGVGKLSQLTSLDLGDNCISSIDTGMLEKLPNLRYFNIESNQLTSFQGIQVTWQHKHSSGQVFKKVPNFQISQCRFRRSHGILADSNRVIIDDNFLQSIWSTLNSLH